MGNNSYLRLDNTTLAIISKPLSVDDKSRSKSGKSRCNLSI